MEPERPKSAVEVILKVIAVLIVIAIVGFGLLLGVCGLMFR
jgi:hypothetical protein